MLKQEWVRCRTAFERWHKQTYELILRSRGSLVELSREDLVDIAFISRKIAELAKDTRTELDSFRTEVGNVFCAQTMVSSDAEESVRGEFATGTPSFTTVVAPPKRGSPEYGQLLDHLGIKVPPHLLGSVEIHYTDLCEIAARAATQGKHVPGLKAQEAKFSLATRATTRS